jgi:hypothetical protein
LSFSLLYLTSHGSSASEINVNEFCFEDTIGIIWVRANPQQCIYHCEVIQNNTRNLHKHPRHKRISNTSLLLASRSPTAAVTWPRHDLLRLTGARGNVLPHQVPSDGIAAAMCVPVL